MKTYDKMLVAIYEPDWNCHADKGAWLYVAQPKDTKKGLFRLPNYIYYFISLDEKRMPSEYGVVKTISPSITARDLAEADYVSRNKDVSSITEEIIEEYERFLTTINAQPEHTPMAVTWFEKLFPIKEKRLKVHKKFFSGLTKEEKAELFEN
ncbi:hypothetical protein [Exiguobacterium sp. s16]|uniref:hypothetical protein n=1 Tax=unclassified Exiguobacterium TaxID=2644629 RepID=UPI0005135181|nr:hypothetical protein JY98_08360 [Exiguobacterium mexicanum]